MKLKDPDVIVDGSKTTNQEAYSLDVDVTGQVITIYGNTTAAVFYGIQSLLAIMDDEGLYSLVIFPFSLLDNLERMLAYKLTL